MAEQRETGVPEFSIPLLDLTAQNNRLRDEVHRAIDGVIDSSQFILGPEVEALELEIAAYSGCRFGVGVSSGTDALLVSLMAVGIKPGDEVITSAYSFFATAGGIARLGARPVFVDIDKDTLNLNPEGIEEAITDRTRAIIPVHLCGQMADMDPILALAKRYGLYLIEDAAQAIGAEYKEQRAGSIGHVGSFSFFPSKNLGGFGDSGMVTTNDGELADRLRLLRNHGHRPKYYNQVIGGNFRMDAIQAAVLRVKLNYLDAWTDARIAHAATYRRLFLDSGLTEEISGPARVSLPIEHGNRKHIYHLYQIRAARRDELISWLKQHGIGCEVYYPVPLHLQECFRELGYKPGDLPESERAARETLALPIYPELTDSMQRQVVDCIASFYRL
jgi:dTDP-4-amino-4,6-dideoxygalactose transaminase